LGDFVGFVPLLNYCNWLKAHRCLITAISISGILLGYSIFLMPSTLLSSESRSGIFCPTDVRPVHASAKVPMPLPRTGPPSFCPFSPEAILLTRETGKSYKSFNQVNHGSEIALRIEADTGPWLRPAQYERKARAVGNANI
jgi:hypothetical protein